MPGYARSKANPLWLPLAYVENLAAFSSIENGRRIWSYTCLIAYQRLVVEAHLESADKVRAAIL